MCNHGISFWLSLQSVLSLPLKELPSELCTCRSLVLLQTSNHGSYVEPPELWINQVTERALSSADPSLRSPCCFKSYLCPVSSGCRGSPAPAGVFWQRGDAGGSADIGCPHPGAPAFAAPSFPRVMCDLCRRVGCRVNPGTCSGVGWPLQRP